MPKYRVLEKSFVNNALVNEGDIVDYDGQAGPNLEPLKGKKAPAPEPDQAGQNGQDGNAGADLT